MYVVAEVLRTAAPVPLIVHVTGTPDRRLPAASLTVAVNVVVPPFAPVEAVVEAPAVEAVVEAPAAEAVVDAPAAEEAAEAPKAE